MYHAERWHIFEQVATSWRARLTLLSCSLEFVAGDPACQCWQPCRFRPEHESESGDHSVARKIHIRTVLVARLVVTVRVEIFGLFIAPFRRMAGILDSFIDRKRRHAHTRQAEMIRTVIVSRLRPRIRTDRQMKILRCRLHHGIKRRTLRAADLYFI